MRLVALTGGIATGKSYCLQRFAQLGARTISADQVAREVVAPGTQGLAQVVSRFGLAMLRSDGSLDRATLAAAVFADANARRDLEAIIHPRVYEAILAWARQDHPADAVLIADIPLLSETRREAGFDRVIVAACSREQQLARLIARDGLTPKEAEQRIATQMPIDEKAGRADYVIDTSKTLDDTDRGVLEVWLELMETARPSSPRNP